MKLLKRSLVLLGCALAAAAAFTACELGLGGDDRLETSQGSGTGTGSGSGTGTGGNTGNTSGTPFIEATFKAEWTGTPSFYLLQQLGSISVTDSEGKDTSKEYTGGTEWWQGHKSTTSLTLENGESITWNVTVTSDTYGLVLEGVKDAKYLDLNLNYAKADDAWGAGVWNVKSYDADAYGKEGHTYEIKVSADAAGSVYTVSVTDKGENPAAGGDDGDDDEPSDTPEEPSKPFTSEKIYVGLGGENTFNISKVEIDG
ncbi:MAG: hypothetical protein J1F14_07725 [Treponema sp.]|nr:hypothetical protein [Treponema sp.]